MKEGAATGASPSQATGATAAARHAGTIGGAGHANTAGSAQVANGAGQSGANATHAKGATGAATVGASKAFVAQVRDPEEAKSFPLPASVHHRAASTPSVAAEAAVAPGAASDAEIRKALGEEAQAKAQERAAQQRVLTPVAGGFSVGGNGTIPIPAGVPETVQRVIAGGNAIADFPYIWGGGHGSFVANGYDCSGSGSYALAGGGLPGAPAGLGRPGTAGG